MSKSKTLEAYIQRQILTAPPANPLVRFRLKHGKGNTIADYEVAPETVPADLAQEATLTAENDAIALSGRQVYALYAYRRDDGPEHSGRHAFAITAEDPEESAGMEPMDAPTDKGLLSQLMRHNEATQRIMVMTLGESLRNQTNVIRAQAEQIESMQRREAEVAQLREELLIGRVQQAAAEGSAATSDAFKAEALQRIMELAPLVVPRILAMLNPPAAPEKPKRTRRLKLAGQGGTDNV